MSEKIMTVPHSGKKSYEAKSWSFFWIKQENWEELVENTNPVFFLFLDFCRHWSTFYFYLQPFSIALPLPLTLPNDFHWNWWICRWIFNNGFY